MLPALKNNLHLTNKLKIGPTFHLCSTFFSTTHNVKKKSYNNVPEMFKFNPQTRIRNIISLPIDIIVLTVMFQIFTANLLLKIQRFEH